MPPREPSTILPGSFSLLIAAMSAIPACMFDLSPPNVTTAGEDAGTSDSGPDAGSDSGPDGDTSDVGEDALDVHQEDTDSSPVCVVLDVAEPNPMGPFVMRATIAPGIGNAFAPDDLLVQLRENATEQAAGTFDLSKGNDANYATCEHCFLLREDLDETGEPAKTYYPSSGTVTVESVQSPPTPSFAMTLEGVELVEVTIDPNTDLSVPVEGGDCFRIELAEWDRTDVGDGECASRSSCIDCCDAYHPVSHEAAGGVLKTCACGQVACEADCSDNYCAGVPATAACVACLYANAFAACATAVSAACEGTSDCADWIACYSGCQ